MKIKSKEGLAKAVDIFNTIIECGYAVVDTNIILKIMSGSDCLLKIQYMLQRGSSNRNNEICLSKNDSILSRNTLSGCSTKPFSLDETTPEEKIEQMEKRQRTIKPEHFDRVLRDSCRIQRQQEMMKFAKKKDSILFQDQKRRKYPVQ